MTSHNRSPHPSSPETLTLPGRRAVWWVFGTLAVLLPFALMISGGPRGGAQDLEGLRFQVRLRNVLWRMTQLSPRATTATRGGSAARARPSTPLPSPKKPASQRGGEAAAGQTHDPATADDGAPPASVAGDRDDRPALRQAPASAGRLPTSQELMEKTVVELFGHARTPAGREMVVAHAIAIEADETATRLASRLEAPSPAIRATLAATARRRGDPAVSPLAMAVTPAVAVVSGGDFGSGWGPFIRQRVRARVYTLAGDRRRAREANAELAWSDDTLLPLLYTLLQGLMMAGLFGGGIWLLGFMRVSVSRREAAKGMVANGGPPPPSASELTAKGHEPSAPQQSAPPAGPLGWLRMRHPGLGSQPVYARDKLLPLLGFGAWLTVYLLAGLLMKLIPGPREAIGFQVLFQSLSGAVFAAWVISAFSRTQLPLDAARLRPAAGGASPWRASTAALWAYCAVLPPMLLVALVNMVVADLAGMDGAAPHPVVGMLLENGDPMQLIALGVAVSIGAPLGEELIFRGFLYRALRRHGGILLSAAISGAVFSLVHMSPAAFLPYMTLGVAFALVFEWTGSLWASIVLHGLWNAVVFGCMAVITLS